MSYENENNLKPAFKKFLDDAHPKKSMKVPDGYFDQLGDSVFDKIYADTSPVQKTPARIITFPFKSWVMSAAAALIILVSALFVFKYNTTSSDAFAINIPVENGWEYLMGISDDYVIEDFASLADMDQVITSMEAELFGNKITEQFIDDVDLETIEELYEY